LNQSITINPNRIIKGLFIGILGLTIASLAINLTAFFTGYRDIFGLVRLLGLEYENNLPTWYQSIALLFSSILLGIIAFVKSSQEPRWFPYWRTLAIIFSFLSLDEVASLHELLVRPSQLLFKPTGFLYYGWVIPASVIVLAIFLKFLKFLLQLPTHTKRLFFLAGTVYILGAIGAEMVSGYVDSQSGMQNLAYLISTTVEEFLEMLGILILIDALLNYMNLYIKPVEIRFQKLGNHSAD
jgi:hypothetical protein